MEILKSKYLAIQAIPGNSVRFGKFPGKFLNNLNLILMFINKCFYSFWAIYAIHGNFKILTYHEK